MKDMDHTGKTKKESKTQLVTPKTNIHILLNILKSYYVKVHRGKVKPVQSEGIDRLADAKPSASVQHTKTETATNPPKPAPQTTHLTPSRTHTPP